MDLRRRPARARTLRAAVAAVALLGALAACSSGGSGGTSDSDGSTTAAGGVIGGGDGAGTYVSIGDSYAQGYQPAAEGQDPDYRDGYAYLLPGLAADKGYDLDLVNFGCGGATVGSLADEPGCDPGARAPDGPVYDSSQLDAAVTYLEDHPGEVELLTVSIGGNDVTDCAQDDDPIACVTGTVGDIDEALQDLLPQLREAAGPETVIVGLTYPDVILGAYLVGGDQGEQLAELSVVAFQQLINPMLKRNYEAVGGIFIDVTEATGAYTPLAETTTLEPYGEIPEAVADVCTLTWFCERQDIHPRSEGYTQIAELIVAALPDQP